MREPPPLADRLALLACALMLAAAGSVTVIMGGWVPPLPHSRLTPVGCLLVAVAAAWAILR